MNKDTALGYIARQDAGRFGWQSLRGLHGAGSAWPTQDNPLLEVLVDKALTAIDEGTPRTDAVMHAILHAWYEGHIEGYDHGHRHALNLPETDTPQERRGNV